MSKVNLVDCVKSNPKEYMRMQEIFGDKTKDAIENAHCLLELNRKLRPGNEHYMYDEYGQKVVMTSTGIKRVGTITVDSEIHFGQEERIKKANYQKYITTLLSMITIGVMIFILSSL